MGRQGCSRTDESRMKVKMEAMASEVKVEAAELEAAKMEAAKMEAAEMEVAEVEAAEMGAATEVEVAATKVHVEAAWQRVVGVLGRRGREVRGFRVGMQVVLLTP